MPATRAPRPEVAAEPRPHLRVVADAPGRSRRRTRFLTTVAAVAVVAGLFGIVCLHVLLSQGQVRLDRLQAQATELESRSERLRVQVAELESPNRIVGVARGQMGMVTPTSVIPIAVGPGVPGVSGVSGVPGVPGGPAASPGTSR